MRTAFGEEFDVPDGYLNTASIGIPSRRVADAVAAAVQDWRQGRSAPPDFDPAVAAARAGFAALVGRRGRPGRERCRGVGAGRADRGEPARRHPGAGGARASSPASRSRSRRRRRGAWSSRSAGGDDLVARAADADVVAVSVVQSADGRDRRPRRRCARRRPPAPGSCSTPPSRWAGSTSTSAGPTSWSAPATSGCSARAARRGWRSARGWSRSWSSSRTRRAGTPGTIPGPPSTGCRCGSPRTRGRSTSRPTWFSQVGAAVAVPWLAGLDRAAVRAHCAGLADALRAEVGMPPTGSAIVSVGDGSRRRRRGG